MYKATKLNESETLNLQSLIAEVKEHEERTVTLLGEALPLTLNHVWGNETVTLLNDLIHALSPVNKKAAIVFFDALQAHEYGTDSKDKRVKRYGKRISKAHTYATKSAMEKFFSLDPETGEVNPEEGYFGGDYWLWADTNIKVEKANIDYMEGVYKAIAYAEDERKGGLELDDILTGIIKKRGISVGHFMSLLKESAPLIEVQIAEEMQKEAA